GQGEEALAIRHGQRWREVFEVLAAPAVEPLQLRERGRYLAIGGLGGIGRALVSHLADQTHVHLVLVGRSVLPDEAEWDALSSTSADAELAARIGFLRGLRARGITWELHAPALDSVLAWREWLDAQAPFHGVVHAAGI